MGLFHRKKELCARAGCNHPKSKHCSYEEAVKLGKLDGSCKVLDCPCSNQLYGYIKSNEEKIRVFKETGVDPYYIDQLILNGCSEGKNIDKNGKEFWVCGHCQSNVRFNTRAEYVSHHQRVHS